MDTLFSPFFRLLSSLVLGVLFTVLFIVALRHPPAWTLDIGNEQSHDQRFLSHFSVPETNAHDAVTFRWSAPKSRMLLHGVGGSSSVLTLRMFGDERADATTAPNDWHMLIRREERDTPLATLPMLHGWRDYHVLLPAGATVGKKLEAIPLALESTNYQQATRDNRQLGVPLAELRITPLQGGVAPWSYPLAQALMLTWVLVVMTLLVAFLRLLLFKKRLPFLPHVVLCLVGGVLVLWAQRDPFTLLWSLPATPWILGITTLVLVRLTSSLSLEPLPLPLSPITAIVLIGILGLAQGLFWSQTAIGVGVALAAVAILSLSFLPPPTLPTATQETPTTKLQAVQYGYLLGMAPWVWLTLICLVALVLRYYRLDDLPYGLWRDEARHGLIALRMLQDPTYRPIYVAEGGVNMPALGFYPFALAIQLFGVQDWTMRTVTALAGALTIFPLYALVKELLKSSTTALIAAALLAASSWHITMSRFSFPSVFEPLLALTGLWLLIQVINRNISPTDSTSSHLPFASVGMVLGAGLCFGVAVQNYHTGRVVPVVAMIAILFVVTSMPLQRWLKIVAMLVVGMVLALLPLILYATNNPAAFNQRVERVFIMGEEARNGRAPLAVLDESVGKHALMFNYRGDSNGRHHAPNKPLLDFFTGWGLLIGMGVILRRWSLLPFSLPAFAVAISITPSLFAVEGPHAMRSIGAIAFVCIIAAVGLVEFGASIRAVLASYWYANHDQVVRVVQMAGVGLVAMVIAVNSWMYFGFMAQEPDVWVSSYPIHTQMGSYLSSLARQEGAATTETNYGKQVYVHEKIAQNSVFVYLTYNLSIQTFHDTSLSMPITDGARFILSGYTYQQDVARLAPYLGEHPTPIYTGPLLPDGHSPSFYVYAAMPQTLQQGSP